MEQDARKPLPARAVEILYGVTSGDRRRRSRIALLGPMLFFIIVGGFVWAALVLDRWLSLPALPGYPTALLLALPLVAGGVTLTGWSIVTFFRSAGTPSPLDPPRKLIVHGFYRYIRNPMLTGEILLGFALGFLLRSFSIVVLFTPLFAALLIVEIKLIEEPELIRRLGEPYLAYRRSVPMFVPRCKRYRDS